MVFVLFSSLLIIFKHVTVGCKLQAIHEIKAVKEPKCIFCSILYELTSKLTDI